MHENKPIHLPFPHCSFIISGNRNFIQSIPFFILYTTSYCLLVFVPPTKVKESDRILVFYVPCIVLTISLRNQMYMLSMNHIEVTIE